MKKIKRATKPTTLASTDVAPVTSENTVAADEVQTEEDATPESNAGTIDNPKDAAYRFNPAPAYPALSRRLQEEGKVILKVHVNPEGDAIEVRVQVSSGFDRLDRAAVSAVQNWKFEPAQSNGLTVNTWVLVPILFRLKGS